MVAPLVTAAGDVTERDTRDGLVTSSHHLHVADTQAQARSRWVVTSQGSHTCLFSAS